VFYFSAKTRPVLTFLFASVNDVFLRFKRLGNFILAYSIFGSNARNYI